MTFQCGYCNKTYKLKSTYDKHAIVCKFMMNKSNVNKSIIEDESPTNKQLYYVIQLLALKCDNLEKKIDKLLMINNKKINIIEWLNENKKITINYINWIDTIEITENHIDLVFEYDLYEAIRLIMKNKFIETNAEDLPIMAFEQKNNILFVYNDEWTMITPELFNLLFNKITKGLLREFNLWQEKHKDKLYENHFSDKYKTYLKKMLGGDLTREQQCIKIKHLLYNDIKNNIKNIIHYDFEF